VGCASGTEDERSRDQRSGNEREEDGRDERLSESAPNSCKVEGEGDTANPFLPKLRTHQSRGSQRKSAANPNQTGTGQPFVATGTINIAYRYLDLEHQTESTQMSSSIC